MVGISSPPGATIGGSIRFSVTDSEPKIARSSGQIAMPALAIWFGGRLTISAPRNLTWPSRRGTSPMIDFIVVVLPAPLRPSNVTTSPSRTAKSTPCRMWLSPYQAFSPLIFSIAPSGIAPSGIPGSGMGELGAEIGGDHLGVFRYLGVVALSQHAAAGKHGDGVAKPFHHGQVMFHHQNGPANADAADQFDDAVDVAMRHAGGRLVEQQHFRLQRQRRRDF